MPKPFAGQLGSLLKGAGLLEQVCGAWKDSQQFFASQPFERRLVQIYYGEIAAPDNQEGGRFDFAQMVGGQVRPSATRDHGGDLLPKLGSSNQRRGCSRA